jgi:hydrogenase small subunit
MNHLQLRGSAVLRMEQSRAIDQIHVLWITAGLGCDGDSIAMTAATQPSIEDIVLGGIPRIPKVLLYHPLFAQEVGEDFLRYFHLAAENQLEPFILVVEGSIPNEKNTERAGC